MILDNLRIRNLKDESKKMSKSEPEGCLFLTDDYETIYRKIMKAKTDSLSGISYDKVNRRALSNLIEIRSSLKSYDFPFPFSSTSTSTKGHQEFKEELAAEIEKHFRDFRENYVNISDEKCDEILFDGAKNVSKLAAKTLNEFLNSINK